MEEKIKNKKEINKQMVIIIVSIIVTVLSTIGVTLAAFVWTDTSEKVQNVIAGDLNLEISSNSQPLGSSLDVPVKDEEVDSLDPYEFTITNNGKLDTYFKLKIADDTDAITKDNCNGKQIDKQYIGIKVTDGTNIIGLLNEYDDIPIDVGLLKPSESKTYKL